MRFSRLRRAAAGVRVCFPFKAEHYFTMWTRLALSHSATEGAGVVPTLWPLGTPLPSASTLAFV